MMIVHGEKKKKNEGHTKSYKMSQNNIECQQIRWLEGCHVCGMLKSASQSTIGILNGHD